MLSWFKGSSGRIFFWLTIISVKSVGGAYFWVAFLNVWWGVWYWHLFHLVILLALIYLALIIVVRRLNDLGQSYLWGALVLLPPLHLLILIPLGFFKGYGRQVNRQTP